MTTSKDILLSLVQGDDGNKWASNTKREGWISNSNKKVCQWDGIECDSHGNIIAIILKESGLSASLPSQLGKLTSLRKIHLETNNIYGTIPSELTNLPHLEILNLYKNQITGTLKSFASSKLQILDLRSNSINGPIPTEFVTATSSCIEISLCQNFISGTIPLSFYKLSTLDTLDLANNLISGTISEKIGDLMFLEKLYLNNNIFIGTIPSSLAMPNPLNKNVGDLLKHVWLNDNQLSGTIPIQLSDLPNLRSLLLHNNKLTGEIPSDLCSEFLNANFFHNAPPDRDKNYCNAIACPSGHTAVKSAYPCSPCIDKHHNPYIGQWGPCVTDMNQRNTMKIFYQKTSLEGAWTDGGDGKKGDNWMDDLIFICDFTGVKCDLNYHVIEINLSNRGLHGTLPGEIGFLPYLELLDVSDNNLSGFLPSDLRWAPLKSLDISGNRIKGIIPPTLCAKGGLNSNDKVNDFDCYHIACPGGLYSPSGRRDLTKDEDCKPCHHIIPLYLGFKGCERSGAPSDVFGFFFVLLTLGIAVVIFVIAFYCFRKQIKSRFRRDEGGIALYEFARVDENGRLERDAMMDEYVASAGRNSGVSGMPSLYSDVPSQMQIMAVSNTLKTPERGNERNMDGSSVNSISVSSSKLKPSDGSVGSRSTRSSGSRRHKKTHVMKRQSNNSLKANQEVRQPIHMQRKNKQDQKSVGSDNSNKGDAKVWLDVPVV